MFRQPRPASFVPSAAFGLAGLCCSLALVGLLFGRDADALIRLLVPASAVAAGGVGGAVWWLVVSRPDRRGRRRGAAAGVAVSLLTYPVTWSISFLALGLLNADPVVAGRPLTVGSGLRLGLFYTGASVFIVGFPTAVVGAVVGVGLVERRARRRLVDAV